MPFTEPADRRKMDKLVDLQRELALAAKNVKPGDRCFLEYRNMMRKWKANRRWTTADEILSAMFPEDSQRAFFLAYLVFFIKHVMQYEREKCRENGDITGEE